jgi:hypothetical protein
MLDDKVADKKNEYEYSSDVSANGYRRAAGGESRLLFLDRQDQPRHGGRHHGALLNLAVRAKESITCMAISKL